MLKHILLFAFVATFSFSFIASVAEANDTEVSLLVVIRSQTNQWHHDLAEQRKTNLDQQIAKSSLNAQVLLLHREWPIEQAWVILPIVPDLSRKYADNFDWVMFIEEDTQVDMKVLMKDILPKYNREDKLFMGRCLFDNFPTIIHHYAFFDGKVKDFKYPDFDSGWLMSRALLKVVAVEYDGNDQNMDFQIDVKHEIAMYMDKNIGVKLTCVPGLCGGVKGDVCATFVDPTLHDCGHEVSLDDVQISVKTTKKFHKDRVQVVKKTWGPYVKHITYYSNVSDPTVPTIDCGVQNTPTGHCGKMEVIIKDFYKKDEMKHLKWLVIADDDSIIGVSRMVKLLNCYNHNSPIVLGERYGYGLNKGYGYGYITGGGSMVMSRGAVSAWFKHECSCPSISTPDDMYLGQCFSFNVGVPVVHSPLFHQARPVDYSDGYLSNQQPISFHKHWEINAYDVYNEWFADDDKEMYGTKQATSTAPPTAQTATPTAPPEAQPQPIPPTPTESQIKDEL
uniref:beta-1,3-glucosyltransferase-like n=1 Tax=Ciona intestinalis TaxID=7719 RepID=UPI000180BC23|nr:beta-1,3-glucosyltransferase-like [Ciona intestinalis]|eukprot:XP_009861006.1 beta-1,3-glucosyltransferase-like [Ciona intestinalis]